MSFNGQNKMSCGCHKNCQCDGKCQCNSCPGKKSTKHAGHEQHGESSEHTKPHEKK